ncbi:MAG: glycosyl hydrolase, partial [Kribbellaceae bacterium]|nr:glycosyl hydrolase [Kribbellaceae bacterium]
GWGLTTQAAARQALTDARNSLLQKHDPYAVAAGVAASVALGVRDWSGPQATIALAAAAQAARLLGRTTADTFAEDDAVVGVARWIAQNHIGQNIAEPTSKLTSDADHALLTGQLSIAVSKLTAASRS